MMRLLSGTILFCTSVSGSEQPRCLTADEVVPVAMCSLVFQNVVPVICAQLKFDRRKVQSAILLGSGVS
jgi:hypothetical protein